MRALNGIVEKIPAGFQSARILNRFLESGAAASQGRLAVLPRYRTLIGQEKNGGVSDLVPRHACQNPYVWYGHSPLIPLFGL